MLGRPRRAAARKPQRSATADAPSYLSPSFATTIASPSFAATAAWLAFVDGRASDAPGLAPWELGLRWA